MVYDYVITLKKPDYRFVDQVSQLLYVFAVVAFGYFFYVYQSKGIAYIVVMAAILIVWLIKMKQKRNNDNAFFRLGLLFGAIGWVIGPEQNVWMALLYAIAALLEKQVKFPQEIGFTKEEIAFNSFPKKKVDWSELNNVVIKDGLITIDYKDNKLVQKEIDEPVSLGIEIEFNDFCKTRLSEERERCFL